MNCDIHALNEKMQDIMPILDQHLKASEEAQTLGNLSFKDAYNIAVRHQVMEMQWRHAYPHDMDGIEQQVFEQTAPVFIDLNMIAEKAEGDEKQRIQYKIDGLLGLYRDCGFTLDHEKHQNYPVHPHAILGCV